jgi:hypothetical protein
VEKPESISQSFISTIAHSDLAHVTQDLTEVALDSLLDNGILKDIPVIGTIVGIYKGVVSIREQMFIKKIAKFLNSLSEISAKEREDMFIKLEEEGHKRQEVGEGILLILDQVDNYEKARLLGVLLKTLSTSLTNYETFKRFSSIINTVYIDDIMSLPSFINEQKSFTATSLQSQGLVYTNSYWLDEGQPDLSYTISPLGSLLCKALEMG